ncbi:lysophospholipid acyltransferase family protein [Elongatibacter sediminis]|uniref:Lysophospholipid acyltransferase family protein n=1 Tax=Elongatibacter sediminis TaxID=3119006 RepID=A0AAW9RIH2_9GAMM
MSGWRLFYRVPWLLAHLLIGLPLTLLTFLPPFNRPPASGRSVNEVVQAWWAAMVCRIFGLRRKVSGSFEPGPHLVAANHISWLDIQLLHSLSTMGFVAKAEIERWPLAGWLARIGETVFHQRGNHDSSRGVVVTMAERLKNGRKVAIFAEGGILPGPGIKRFHARLFAAALESNAWVQPVMVRYVRAGAADEEVTFLPGEGFLGNFFRLLARSPCTAEVWILPRFRPGDLPRREIALRAQKAVEQAWASAPLP